MNDFLGQHLIAGDWVVLTNSGRGGNLYLCKIVGFKKGRMYLVKASSYGTFYYTHTERFGECIKVPLDTIDLNKQLAMEPEWQKFTNKFGV